MDSRNGQDTVHRRPRADDTAAQVERLHCEGQNAIVLRVRRDGAASLRPFASVTRPRLQAPGENALLRVQAVLGLVEDDGLRTVDHFVGDFLAAVGRQAMHEDRILGGGRHQPALT